MGHVNEAEMPDNGDWHEPKALSTSPSRICQLVPTSSQAVWVLLANRVPPLVSLLMLWPTY